MSEYDLKHAVQAWAKQREIRPTDFAKATGYSYNHAYQVLLGDAAVTAETLGRITLAYGAGAVMEIEKTAQELPTTHLKEM